MSLIKQISIISPVYRAEKIVLELYEKIVHEMSVNSLDFELVLVDDHSPDMSWSIIDSICSKDRRVKGVKLSRNFGQHYAITAGLSLASYDWVVVMDCDLQDQPFEIINLINHAVKNNSDAVLASREDRQDSFLKKMVSKLFYKTLSYFTGDKIDGSVANFGIYNRKVVNAILDMKDSIRYFPTMVRWVGFDISKINVQHAERSEGKSSYNLKKLMKLAVDVILVNSDKPIRNIIKFGVLMSLISFSSAIYYLINYLNGSIKVLGYASIIISIWFLSGMVLLTLGVVGLYVGKIFESVKNRPVFIISQKKNFENDTN